MENKGLISFSLVIAILLIGGCLVLLATGGKGFTTQEHHTQACPAGTMRIGDTCSQP
jgi:hypothetical protein